MLEREHGSHHFRNLNIKILRSEKLFIKETSPSMKVEPDKMNRLKDLAIPLINSDRRSDIASLAGQTGADPDMVKRLIDGIIRKLLKQMLSNISFSSSSFSLQPPALVPGRWWIYPYRPQMRQRRQPHLSYSEIRHIQEARQ